MDEIAETAHVSKPVLYQHFPSKRELYLALLDSDLTGLTELMLGALNSTTDNKQRVQAVMRAYYRFIANDDQAHRLVFESDLINDPDVSARLETFNKTFADAVAKGYQLPIPARLYYARLTQWSTGIREFSTFENSWVAVREVSIGYNLPNRFAQKLRFNQLRMNIVGRNLGYLYTTLPEGFNPESIFSNRAGTFAEY